MKNQDQVVQVLDLEAPVARVWQAISDYRQFGEWFCVNLNEPFSPGEKSTGITTYPGYEGFEWLATVESVEPQHLLSFHWHHEIPNSGRALNEEPTTRVEFCLEESNGGTRLTITESGFSSLPESLREETIRSNTQGWEIQADNIRKHVARHA